MICEQCKASGLESKVYKGATMTTLMAYQEYFDEQGKRHIHDSNRKATAYSCSNGHSWNVEHRTPCPTCGENWHGKN